MNISSGNWIVDVCVSRICRICENSHREERKLLTESICLFVSSSGSRFERQHTREWADVVARGRGQPGPGAALFDAGVLAARPEPSRVGDGAIADATVRLRRERAAAALSRGRDGAVPGVSPMRSGLSAGIDAARSPTLLLSRQSAASRCTAPRSISLRLFHLRREHTDENVHDHHRVAASR